MLSRTSSSRLASSRKSRLTATTSIAFIALALVVSSWLLFAKAAYRVVDLGIPSQASGMAYGINQAGVVVGVYTVGPSNYGFLWNQGSIVDIGPLGSGGSANAINNRGDVVGSRTDSTGRTRAFLWYRGSFTDVGVASLRAPRPSASNQGFAVNDRGQIVGHFTSRVGVTHAFIWDQGVMTELSTPTGQYSSARAINNRGTIAGEYEAGTQYRSAYRACTWSNGALTDLGIPGPASRASGINDAGQVVGAFISSNGSWHAFVWQDRVLTDLGTLGGGDSSASAINNNGQIVGWSQTSGAETHAFMWEGGALTDFGAAGVAAALNDRGEVAGQAYLSGKTSGPRPVLWRFQQLARAIFSRDAQRATRSLRPAIRFAKIQSDEPE
jgi:probable HAF family extracellular repeat protein